MGMRKGELLGLLKNHVDLQGRKLAVARSYDRDTTKGGHADVIPLAKEVVPYLAEAMRRAGGALVFPDENPMPPPPSVKAQGETRQGFPVVVTGLHHSGVLLRPTQRAFGFLHRCEPVTGDEFQFRRAQAGYTVSTRPRSLSNRGY